nr:immunoglobulin light chain junction region [Mus musculus]NSM00537.1 immunoglobulin light chain junction region [Mus musculus]NSM01560.1 immunoglobulin light chain junction region [Mus musculus]NSM02078.1 immunoglobulin light chain junction region [Mus musculus]NSM02127.1 immunoglobulin light chain junction region [Mus musculus]
CQQYSKLPWTF